MARVGRDKHDDNLRAGKLGNGLLLLRVFFNVFLAGELNQFENVTESGIQTFMAESGFHLGSAAADAMVGKVTGKLGAKASSGYLNSRMLSRLGDRAISLLRPVRLD